MNKYSSDSLELVICCHNIVHEQRKGAYMNKLFMLTEDEWEELLEIIEELDEQED